MRLKSEWCNTVGSSGVVRFPLFRIKGTLPVGGHWPRLSSRGWELLTKKRLKKQMSLSIQSERVPGRDREGGALFVWPLSHGGMDETQFAPRTQNDFTKISQSTIMAQWRIWNRSSGEVCASRADTRDRDTAWCEMVLDKRGAYFDIRRDRFLWFIECRPGGPVSGYVRKHVRGDQPSGFIKRL